MCDKSKGRRNVLRKNEYKKRTGRQMGKELKMDMRGDEPKQNKKAKTDGSKM